MGHTGKLNGPVPCPTNEPARKANRFSGSTRNGTRIDEGLSSRCITLQSESVSTTLQVPVSSDSRRRHRSPRQFRRGTEKIAPREEKRGCCADDVSNPI